MKKRRKWIIGIIVLLLLAVAGTGYVQDYYRSDDMVQTYLKSESPVKTEIIKEGLFLDGPGEENAFIFYPGAKVEYTAYIPLLYKLSEQGVDVFLVKMPCNLAFLGKNKADSIMETYDYDHWYMGGHSLGGAMAAAYASGHLYSLNGLVLLAAYPTDSLQAEGFEVLSLYGSEDGVLNMEKVEEGKKYMPQAYREICIQGGNHAQFGNYGRQKKDGEATISSEEQQEQTVKEICEMIK